MGLRRIFSLNSKSQQPAKADFSPTLERHASSRKGLFVNTKKSVAPLPCIPKESETIVRFGGELVISATTAVDDLSDEEYRDLWLTKLELKQIRKRERKLAQQRFYEGDVGIDDDAFGLESNEDRISKHYLIESSIEAVLQEQKNQYKRRMCDPEQIAWVYSLTSLESGSLAHERGLTNHYQLLEINRPERRRWSTGQEKRHLEAPPEGTRMRRRGSIAY